LHPLGKKVGPAVVCVHGGAVTIGNGVAQDDNGRRNTSGDIHPGDEIPVFYLLGVRQVGSGYLVAMHHVGRGSRARVARLLSRFLVDVKSDCQIRKCRHGIGDRIGNIVGARRYRDIQLAGEGQSLIATGNDLVGSGGNRTRNMHGREAQGRDAESIREMHPQFRAAHRQMNNLTQRRIVQVRWRKRIGGFGELLGCGP